MRIELSSGTPAELVAAAGAERALVVVPDVMGLRPLFVEMAERLAADLGRAVCVPELYPGREHLDITARLAEASQLDDHRVLGDLLLAAEATGAADVGIIGFCMGGMYALKSVATSRFDRHVSFYGMIVLPADWAGPGQAEPLDALGSDAQSVLAIIGGQDPYTPASDVDALKATGASVVSYPDAAHGFVHDPTRPAHRHTDASDAWRRAEAWLAG